MLLYSILYCLSEPPIHLDAVKMHPFSVRLLLLCLLLKARESSAFVDDVKTALNSAKGYLGKTSSGLGSALSIAMIF
jgi:hypothetical protein